MHGLLQDMRDKDGGEGFAAAAAAAAAAPRDWSGLACNEAAYAYGTKCMQME